eukprot:1229415-Rhodomonas_salina.2
MHSVLPVLAARPKVRSTLVKIVFSSRLQARRGVARQVALQLHPLHPPLALSLLSLLSLKEAHLPLRPSLA